MQIKLVPPRPEYAEVFFQWRNQATFKTHNPLAPMDLEGCRRSLLDQGCDLSALWDKPSFRWFVEMNGSVVGNVSLKSINKMMLTAEIGYGIGEEFQGRGIATSAARLLIEKIFNETSIRKLMALVHDQNIPSRKLLSRIGFLEEGTLREHFLIQGTPANAIIYGLLKREWQRR